MARRQRFMGLGTTIEMGGDGTYRDGPGVVRAGDVNLQPVSLDAPSHLLITITRRGNVLSPEFALITSGKTQDALAWLNGALKLAANRDPSAYSAFIKSYPIFEDPNLTANAKVVSVRPRPGRAQDTLIRLFVYGRNGNPIPFGAASALNNLLSQTVFMTDRSANITWVGVAMTNVAGDGMSVNVVTPTPESIPPVGPVNPAMPQRIDVASSALGIFLIVGTVVASVWAWKKVFK
jgi:hypothetical protein